MSQLLLKEEEAREITMIILNLTSRVHSMLRERRVMQVIHNMKSLSSLYKYQMMRWLKEFY
jgi:hypothetical protein